jgi:hypothetical protein
MRFPIDVVFLGADLEVLGIRARLGPWRLAGQRGARQALELRAGAAAELGLAPGMRLRAAAAP